METLKTPRVQSAFARMKSACAETYSAKSRSFSTRSVKLAPQLDPQPTTNIAPLENAATGLPNPEALKDAIDVDAVTVQADAVPERRPLSVISINDTSMMEIPSDTVSERSAAPGINYINKQLMAKGRGSHSARPYTRHRP